MSTFLGPVGPRILLRAVSTISRAATTRCFSCTSTQSRTLQSWSTSRPLAKPRISTSSQSICQRRSLFSRKITREYEELPPKYRDQAGLAFSSKDLTQAEADKIFGPGSDVLAANHLLRILHGRRVAGTLDDPAFMIHTARFTETQKDKALAYLRKTIQVDEVMNAGLRAEDELAELERKEDETKEPEDTTKGNILYKPDPVYGRSTMDEMRARNRAKVKAEEQLEAERKEAKRLEDEQRPMPKQLVQVEQGQRQITSPKVAEYYQKAQSDIKDMPQMTLFERIMPSAVVAALIIGFCASLAMVYEEPSPKYRLLRELSTAQATVGTIIALNLIVWAGWRFPPLWKAFNKYMLFVVGLPKPITLFTAPFSHKQITHLISNMAPLWVIGTQLHDDIGRGNFITLYLSCGALGFLGGLTVYSMAGLLGVYSLGASGANMGICAAYFWLHRNDGFKLFGLPEGGVHGIVFLALLGGYQLASLGSMMSAKYTIDIVSHVFGILAGMGGIEVLKKYSECFTGRHDIVKRTWWGEVIERSEAMEEKMKVAEEEQKKSS